MSPGQWGGGFLLPIVQAQPLKERAQPAKTGQDLPTSPGEEGGTGCAVSGWQPWGAVGWGLPWGGLLASKLGPSPSPAS